MSYTFADLRKDVLSNVTTSPDYFGETVTYVGSGGFTKKIDVHCKHDQRFIFDEQGNQVVIEQIVVTIPRESISQDPAEGHLIYRVGDELGFLYAYSGGDQPHYWRRVFERRVRQSQG